MRITRGIGLALCIAGFLLVGGGLFEVAGGRIYQAWRGKQLDRALDSLPPRPATEVHRVSYSPGSAIGRLEIPRLGLSVIVLEGSDTATLRLGAGRLTNSALPGENGNVVLAAHRDTFFRPLREIRRGDRISLRSPQGTFPYIVDWTKVVDPEDTQVLRATPESTLTLVTCYPFSYLGSAPQRFVVRAVPAGSASAARLAAASPKPSPFANPKAKVSPPPHQPTVAAPEEDPVPVAEDALPAPQADPAQPPKRGFLSGAFHKVAGVFSTRRAKLQ